jgi:hypothetical protein
MILKQTVTASVEGIRKRWTGEVEENLNIIEIGIYYTMATHREQWWMILLEAKVHNGDTNNNNKNNNL